jgi:Holliday junction resolvase-like predicted endonuclease
MLRGMNRLLAAGHPRINPDLSVSVLDPLGNEVHRLPPMALTKGGIGYVYERVVCIHYANMGYAVSHRASLGYLDQGIDMVAERPGEKVFIQCKYTSQAFSPKKIETLLYAASRFIADNLGPQMNQFDLVVPNESIAFPPRKPGRSARAARDVFMRHNRTQSLIRLRITEVPIDIPDEILLGI